MSDLKEPTLKDVFGSIQRMHARMDNAEELADLVRKSVGASEVVKSQMLKVLKYFRALVPKVKRIELEQERMATELKDARDKLRDHDDRLTRLERNRA